MKEESILLRPLRTRLPHYGRCCRQSVLMLGTIRDPHPLHKPATLHKKRTEGSILFFDLPQSLCDSDSKSFPMDFRRNIALAASTDMGKIKRICRIWNRSQLKQERNFPLVYFSIRESGFSGRIRDQRYFSRDIGNVPLEIRTYSDRKKTRQRRPLKIYIAAVGDDSEGRFFASSETTQVSSRYFISHLPLGTHPCARSRTAGLTLACQAHSPTHPRKDNSAR